MAGVAGLALWLVTGLIAALAHSANGDRDLDGIKKKIELEKRVLSQVKKKESSVIESLSQVEIELERNNKQLRQSTAKLDSVVSEMRKKQAETLRVRESL